MSTMQVWPAIEPLFVWICIRSMAFRVSRFVEITFQGSVKPLKWIHIVQFSHPNGCYRSAQVLSSITTFCPSGILTVSLSPRSVSSCIRSSAVWLSKEMNQVLLVISLYLLSPTCLPCTTFSRKILATFSACSMADIAAGSFEAR
jgi:hypothetical protein